MRGGAGAVEGEGDAKRGGADHFVSLLRLCLIARQDATTDRLLETFPARFVMPSEENCMVMFWVRSGENREGVDLA